MFLLLLPNREMLRRFRLMHSAVAGHCQDVRERDDCRLCLDPPPRRRPLRSKVRHTTESLSSSTLKNMLTSLYYVCIMQTGVPRRSEERHRNQALCLAVPALLPGRDPGSRGYEGIDGGSWPLTLMIGIRWLYVGSHCLAGGFYVIWISIKLIQCTDSFYIWAPSSL